MNKKEFFFPDPNFFDFDGGLVAVGGDLSKERILSAYKLGIFPWYNPGEEILWWCPNPRFVIFPDELYVSKSMRKVMDSNIFNFTENENFVEVIRNCQKMERAGQDGTWLSDELVEALIMLHKEGVAKSVEVWQDGKMVGGLYGLQIGSVFCGESMFAKVSNASKAGFIYFVQKNKFDIIDCQVHTSHLESLGARMISKKEFLKILNSKQ